MTKSALLRSVASYAHLLGRSPKASKAEDDEKKDRDDKDARRKGRADEDKSDDDKKDARRAEEDSDSNPETGDSEEEKKRRRDEEDEQDEGRRDEDDEDKRDRRDDEDAQDEKDRADDADTKMRGARRRERARCRAIFASADAGARPDMAAYLAFETSMSRKEACRALAAVAAGQPKQNGFNARMAGMETLRPGADGGPSPSDRQTRNASWDRTAQRLHLGKNR